MDPAEREMLEAALSRAVTGPSGPALEVALADLGWPDALAHDPEAAVSTLFRLQGQRHASSSALHLVVAAGLGLAADGPPVLLPALGSPAPPGRRSGEGLIVSGTSLVDPADLEPGARMVVALTGTADRDTVDRHGPAGLVTVPAGDLVGERVGGLDPDLGLHRIDAVVGAFEPAAPDYTGAWTEAVSLAQRAIGHELVGAAAAMVELARAHALERVQFGQPIARFQAVRHRLAEALLAVEGADALLKAAWETPSPELSAAARSVAARAARTAARHAQQVLAGIGFTAEHPFHHYLRRVMVLDRLFGTSRSLTAELGRQVLADGRVPALLPL